MTIAKNTSVDYFSWIDALFVSTADADDLRFLRGGQWATSVAFEALPGVVLGIGEYDARPPEALVRLEDGIAQVILQGGSLVLRAAARSSEGLDAVHATIADAFPVAAPDDSVAASIWWWDRRGGPGSVSRPLNTPPWDEVRGNYAPAAATALTDVAAWREPPTNGRLVVLHGPPGTGKTTALRALAGEWRNWAAFGFVSDPEQLLQYPDYLMRMTQPSPFDDDRRTRVVVLEDAGEFLGPDASRRTGQALSRLLNVCDGVSADLVDALVVVTTNEPVGRLHPALTRPGRCAARIEVPLLSSEHAAAWLDRCSNEATPPAGETSLADLFALRQGAPARRARAAAVGFV